MSSAPEKMKDQKQDNQFDRATLVDDGGIKADKSPGPTTEQNKLLVNPLMGLSKEEILARVESFGGLRHSVFLHFVTCEASRAVD